MYCKYLNAECNLIECASYLMGNKRQNKEQRKCYEDRHTKVIRIYQIEHELAEWNKNQPITWIYESKVKELKAEKQRILNSLGL